MLGNKFSRRPSNLLGISDEWAAYQFDLAALAVLQNLEKPSNTNEPKDEEFAPVGGRVSRRVHINEGGDWD